MAETSSLQHTPLHDAHVARGAKMVDFGGWHMPLQYEGILAEHRAVRTAVGIFDVSHMGEVDFTGPGALAAVQRLITNDAAKLTDGKAMYTAVCYPDGGIVDDCIVYRHGPENFRIVVNAANIAKDFAHFQEHAGSLCKIENHSDDVALIAVQGPQARGLVARLAGDDALLQVPSFGFAAATLAGAPIVAARTGYTGEDGFELFVEPARAVAVWDALLASGAASIGLGARDTLRLEAKLCLYGNDIDATTNPLEAGLGWVVKLDKRARGDDFVGGEALAQIKARGNTRSLVGFRVTEGKNIARAGADIVDAGGAVVGKVTSGAPALTVGGAVGIAYVPVALSAPGTALTISQRGKTFAAEVVKGPFYRRAEPAA
ncbi:glycine cleavage system aminomethyltransferase GcvT [Nannocystis pusilla]|uniref:Aminomethyltransferase n=1 Tax=Nannocystis pusilla TaxID=889268 RepID=A0A9X3IWA1_9BACT|nr:glycine cleavage system aminomethyltransferase GcvT [Nannocystis pusilla]MCY1005294.1 glycine cleavage system aminomethyltransferase GcvT [Nannocystis pusilla]